MWDTEIIAVGVALILAGIVSIYLIARKSRS